MSGDALAQIAACAPAGLRWTDALAAEVSRAYSSAGRHYHTIDHVAEVAQRFAEVASEGPGWRDPLSVFAAVLAHDAVYDAARSDNEALSAELGRAWCRELLGIDGERCAQLVLATAHHAGPPSDREEDLDLALFLDCDLAILGADPARYDAYERDVAREYSAVWPEPLYRAGRARFLASMLERPTPFHTAWSTARWGAAARSNLERALAALS